MASSKAPLHSLSGDAAGSDLVAARRVLTTASDALTQLADALNGDFSHAVGRMLAAKGRIIVSGMGKSGHVARKSAATLSSTGTPAFFVHPAEASHGDLGMITRDDVILALSWSGETAELKYLIDYSRRFRIGLIAVTSDAGSTLGHAADIALALPPAPEA